MLAHHKTRSHIANAVVAGFVLSFGSYEFAPGKL